MRFIFGDSHARCLEGLLDGWTVVSIGGATAAGLTSTESVTGARVTIVETLDGSEGPNVVVLIFGDVDCVDHGAIDVEHRVSRYTTFIDELRARPDVEAVGVCHVIPRTSIFEIYDRSAAEVNGTIDVWNSLLPCAIDVTSLRGPDGCLRPEHCHSVDDEEERHLSSAGAAALKSDIERWFASL